MIKDCSIGTRAAAFCSDRRSRVRIDLETSHESDLLVVERAVQRGAGLAGAARLAQRGDELGQDVLIGYGLDRSDVGIGQALDLGACERDHGGSQTFFAALVEPLTVVLAGEVALILMSVCSGS